MRHVIIVGFIITAMGCVLIEDRQAEQRAMALRDTLAVGMTFDRALLAADKAYGRRAWNAWADHCRSPEQIVQLTLRPSERTYTFDVLQLKDGQRTVIASSRQNDLPSLIHAAERIGSDRCKAMEIGSFPWFVPLTLDENGSVASVEQLHYME
jgi:hypothetical protein